MDPRRSSTASRRAPSATRAPDRLDGALLDAICARALGGARGAVFTPAAEARILAAFGLASAAAGRGGPAAAEGVRLLLAGARAPALAAALEGLRVLDPACGGGALLVAAELLARGAGASLRLTGLDLEPLAARAARERLALLGADADVRRADGLAARWPDVDLVIANPPFLRHEALAPAEKAAAARASGLSRQADLSAHFAAVALRRAPVAALVWPRALDVSRSSAPLLADARARGGFVLRLRSRAAGSFAASVDTILAVWAEGAEDAPAAEASAPLAALSDRDLAELARGRDGARIRLRRRAAPAARGAVRLGDVCDVRFGTKTGCNAFFHLRPAGGGRHVSGIAGEVELAPGDVVPLLASLREARAPERAATAGVLFRPSAPGPAALRYVAAGEAAGVHARPTCAGRTPWWRLAPGRGAAPVLYPAKIGARAFAFLNAAGLWEDKKWHALFPRAAPAWQVALVLSATPVRLAIDLGARQLTGAQAIADVDCRVLAAAPFPAAGALEAIAGELAALRPALAHDEVTTDLAAMLARPAQRALDAAVGRALGLSGAEVVRASAALLDRVRARTAHGVAVKAAIAGSFRSSRAQRRQRRREVEGRGGAYTSLFGAACDVGGGGGSGVPPSFARQAGHVPTSSWWCVSSRNPYRPATSRWRISNASNPNSTTFPHRLQMRWSWWSWPKVVSYAFVSPARIAGWRIPASARSGSVRYTVAFEPRIPRAFRSAIRSSIGKCPRRASAASTMAARASVRRSSRVCRKRSNFSSASLVRPSAAGSVGTCLTCAHATGRVVARQRGRNFRVLAGGSAHARWAGPSSHPRILGFG